MTFPAGIPLAGNVMSASSRAVPATSHHRSGAYMKKARITAALGTLAALAVTACGGSTNTAAGSAHPAQNAATAAGATCAQASGIIQDLVNAQATFDASQQTETDDLTYIVALAR